MNKKIVEDMRGVPLPSPEPDKNKSSGTRIVARPEELAKGGKVNTRPENIDPDPNYPAPN